MHEKRTLWLVNIRDAPGTLRAIMKDEMLKVDIWKGILTEWNRGSSGQGKRRTQTVRWKSGPPIWEAKDLEGEPRRCLLKWFLGKVHLPQRERWYYKKKQQPWKCC